MSKTLACLEANGGDLILGDYWIVVDNIGESTTFHKLHHHPQLIILLLQEGVEEVHDVRVLRIFHYNDFVDDQFLAWLIAEIHLFDSNLTFGTMSAVDLSCNGRSTTLLDPRN